MNLNEYVNEKRGLRQIGWIHNSDSLHTWVTQFVLQCDQWFHDGLIFFFHYLLLLERTFGWALSPPPSSAMFVLYLEWSLNISTDKKSNAICIIASLCSTLFRLRFKFSWAWFYFLLKCTKERGIKLTGKNLNVDRQFLKDVTHILWCYSV